MPTFNGRKCTIPMIRLESWPIWSLRNERFAPSRSGIVQFILIFFYPEERGEHRSGNSRRDFTSRSSITESVIGVAGRCCFAPPWSEPRSTFSPRTLTRPTLALHRLHRATCSRLLDRQDGKRRAARCHETVRSDALNECLRSNSFDSLSSRPRRGPEQHRREQRRSERPR